MPESTSPSPISIPQKATLRLARISDAEAIATLGSSVFASTFGYSLSPSDLVTYLQEAYSLTSVQTDILNPSITTLVAVSPISPYPVVGFSQLNRSSTEPCIENEPKPVELQRLYVNTIFQGGGVGKLLVEGIEKIVREEGYETLWLGVWEENLKALGFYRKFGFEECGSHDFKMGECIQTDKIVKKAV